MADKKINKKYRKEIDELVAHYLANTPDLNRFLGQLRGFLSDSEELKGYVHSMKWRQKDPEHLRDKLERKFFSNKAKDFDISKDNLFERVNDLVGIRIIHLHTSQFREIHTCLIKIFDEGRFALLEKPFVRSWDDESKEFFEQCGLEVQSSRSMYTSVHYVVEANQKTRFTCEIQVRTLMEEVWAEVEHRINYPHNTESVACKEQLKALARLTSGCSRLVDSIFNSHKEYNEINS